MAPDTCHTAFKPQFYCPFFLFHFWQRRKVSEKMATDDGSTFPAADVDGELNLGQNNKVEIDAVSSDIAASKEQDEAAGKKVDKEKKDCMQTLKTTILVSCIIVAVAGAAIAITKKLKEK